MPFAMLPSSAAWQHHSSRDGTECVFFAPRGMSGWTAAVEDGHRWVVGYEITVDADTFLTRHARVWHRTDDGPAETVLAADGNGQWTVDGRARPELDGCLDVDLESSAVTNLLAVRRLDLGVGAQAEAPAAYVRALDLRVERLEQSYTRRGDDDGSPAPLAFRYAAPVFAVDVVLRCDAAGLVVHYPHLATRL
jgi:hypothetical protein